MNEQLKIIISAQTAEAQKNIQAATKEIQNLDEQAQKSSNGGFKKAMDAIGSAAKTAAKATAVAFASIATGVVAIGSAAIKEYAEFEQLVGGVETLFKTSSDKVRAYADEAYKTAGLSANAYMETVTSFSASLLQSLGGDTDKAADVANQAITDMSDNANKMGTSMESIQNAYQGFAKQNYTMLDNLKLGYGGTKEEMQRLLEDAQKISGIEYDISNFADITEAIHIVQTELGITGTTAKEAASTIQGSASMMKASWQNLLVGIADENADFDTLLTNFIDSVGAFAENLIPRIEVALGGVVNLISGLVPKIVEVIPQLTENILPKLLDGVAAILDAIINQLPSIITAITKMLPKIVSAIGTVIKGIAAQLPSLLKSILDTIPQLVADILALLPELIPTLVEGIIQMLIMLWECEAQLIQPIVEALPTMIESLITALLDNLPVLIEGIKTIFTSLVEMLPEILPVLVDMIVNVIELIFEALPDIIDLLVGCIVEAINLITEILPSIINTLVDLIVRVVEIIVEQLPIIIPMLIDAVILIVQAIIEALPDILLALTDALPEILSAVWDAIVMIFENLPKWFGQLFMGAVDIIKTEFSAVGEFFDGIWERIKEPFIAIGDWFGNIFSEAWEAIKNVFSSVGSFFAGIWNTIKTQFTEIGEKVGGAISDAFKTAINWVLEKAVGLINGFIDGINWCIDVINKIPGVEIGYIDNLDVPQFAKGGVVDTATLGVFGEAGTEAVVPLENNLEWLDKLATMLTERLGGGAPVILQVDGRALGEITLDSFNNIARQSGSLPLYVGGL